MTTAPILFDGLVDLRPQVRLYAMLALGTVGKQGSCAVGKIAPLLWDSYAYIRSAATLALANITGKDLLPAGLAFTPSHFQTIRCRRIRPSATSAAWPASGGTNRAKISTGIPAMTCAIREISCQLTAISL